MQNPLFIPEIREMLGRSDRRSLTEFCKHEHPAQIAEYLSPLERDEIWEVLRALSYVLRAEIFSHLPAHDQVEIATSLRRIELAKLVNEMPPDDRIDLLRKLPEETSDLLLPALAQAERDDVRRLASYPEGTAGSVMTTEYATVPINATVEEALCTLRREAPDKETIYYAYIVDEQRRLIGFVSLKDIILAHPSMRICDIMHTEVISRNASADREDAARTIQRYDLIALPVVDNDNVLLGIITHDDAVDIITQEHTEDLERLMAIGGSHDAANYMPTSPWKHFLNRVPWLIGLAALGLLSGAVIMSFEETLTSFVILAFFMPMMADTGGNTGSQAATLVIRALALREISPRDFLNVLGKELCTALLLASVLSGLAFARVTFFTSNMSAPPGVDLVRVALAIATALSLQVVSATLIGASLPLIVAAFKKDPAVIASPALTTFVDISGLFIYFSVARWFLNI